MWIGQTTRSPLTAIQTESTFSESYSGWTFRLSETGKTDGAGATSWRTAADSSTATGGTTVGGTTYGGTTNASGGATTRSTGSYTVNYPTAEPTGGGGSASGTTAGAYTNTTLTIGVATSTITNKAGTVSTARSKTYTYPKSTVATSTKVSTQTAETAATQNTTLYGSTTTTTRASGTYTQTTSTGGFITDTSRIAATVAITCSAKFEVIDTAFWLNDDERGWSYTGGAGIRPLNSICYEASDSFTTAVSTTTSARTRNVVATSASTITISLMGVVNSDLTASWTDLATTNVTETDLSLTDLPNSTSTFATVLGYTTSQWTAIVASESFGTTGTSAVYASESYVLFEPFLDFPATQIEVARDNSGGMTGFTTRSTGGARTSSTAASSSAPVAYSGSTGAAAEAQGISETITAIAEWTGLTAQTLFSTLVYYPWVPSGVRVYESFQQKSIYAQIGASGLGFTVPFEAFSIFQRDSVLSPMDTTYTTTDASAGNTRSYTVSVGTSATNDTANFIFVTRATESTTETSTSASLYNTHELTRREYFQDYPYTSITEDGTNSQWVMGGRQRDTRLEIAAFQEGVLDYTVVDTSTIHAGILTTQASYTTSAASSNLTAFRSIPGYSEVRRGEGYSTTPKWITP